MRIKPPGLKTGLYFRYYVFPDNKNRIAERAYSEGAITFTEPEPVTFPTAAIFLHIDMAPIIKIFKPYFHFEMGFSRHKLIEVNASDSSRSWFLLSPFPEETFSFFGYGFGLEIKATNWMNLFGEIRYVDTFKRRSNFGYLASNIGIVLPLRVF